VGEGMDADQVRPRLGEVRLAELTRALELLGAGTPRLLGYRDSGMRGTPGNGHERAFWRADFDRAVGQVVAHIRDVRPDVLVTYDGFGLYGHPDHVQAHRVALVAGEAADVAALYPEAGPAWRVRKVYEVTTPHTFVRMAHEELGRRGLASPFGAEALPDPPPFGMPDELVTTSVDVAAHLPRKLAALRAHRSQLGPDSFFLNVPGELAEAAFGTEWFVRVRSDVPVPAREDDLFAGLD
jgi:LmbE family N-acetylglucosaminyl deacetylase